MKRVLFFDEGRKMAANPIRVLETGKKRLAQPEIVKADLYPEPKLKDFSELKRLNFIETVYFPILDVIETNNLETWISHNGENYCLMFEGYEQLLAQFDNNEIDTGIPLSTSALINFEIIRVNFGDKILSVNVFDIIELGWEFDIDFGTNDDRVLVCGTNVAMLILQRSIHALQGNDQIIIDLRTENSYIKHSSAYGMSRISALVECSEKTILARVEKDKVHKLNQNLEFEEIEHTDINNHLIDQANDLWKDVEDPWKGTIWYE